ncbi:MAG: hypothetical protein KDH16_09940 [Rhodocyclaceae bacterium]|nr:hypothetical protein [Rhodocyclaceae bacterium]
MKRLDITPTTQIARRAPQAGRLRMGVKTERAMRTIPTWRLTSPTRSLIEKAAELWGGTCKPWNDKTANPPNQFEVITDAASIEVMIIPNGISTDYELWSKGGRERQCDGITVGVARQAGDDYEIVDQPCICDARGVRECDPTTRLQVVLPQLPFAGVWRLDSKSWNAAAELPGMVEFIAAAAGQGRLVRALLGIEARKKVVAGRTKHFQVPTLTVMESFDQLNELASANTRPALGPAGEPTLALPSGTEVEIVEAEMIDDELLELEEKLRADARNFGLQEEPYVAAVKAGAANDRARIKACIDLVRNGHLVPLMIQPNGRVQWDDRRPKTKEETS